MRLAKGVYDTLFRLSRREVILALVTACGKKTAMNLLERFELKNAFDYLEFGAAEKEGVIKRLTLRERIEAKRCFYVGDSPSDMIHAKRAGVKAVAFLNGNLSEHLALETGPDYFIRQFSNLITILDATDALESFEPQD